MNTAPTEPAIPPATQALDAPDPAPDHPGRWWAIGVLVLAAAVSMSMNTVHAFKSTTLPDPLALMYGIAPVALAAMQSHSVALRAVRKEVVGTFRKFLTFGLVIGGLGLSFLGIYDLLRHAVPDPIPDTPWHEPAILFSLVVDMMALAALHELLRLTPSLVSAVSPAASGEAPARPVDTPETAVEDPEELPASDEPDDIEPAPITTPLPALGPLRTIPWQMPGTVPAANGSARPGMVTVAVPSFALPEADADAPAEHSEGRRRSTPKERNAAVKKYIASVKKGAPLSQEELGRSCGGWTRPWAKARIDEANAKLLAEGWQISADGRTYTPPADAGEAAPSPN